MRIAGTVQDSIVDGPGLRFVVFSQGCPRACPDCHNPGTLDINGGSDIPVSAIIEEMLKNPLTDGLTLSGGEPFLQAENCSKIALAAKSAGLNVWCYTGYTYEELCKMAKNDADVSALLERTDVLVDGPFLTERRSLALRFRGSDNQRIIDLKKSKKFGMVLPPEGF